MRVVGIDPGPKKGLAIFDGQDRHVPISESRAYIASLASESDVLVCWDAPLTGPSAAVVLGDDGADSSFTKRLIESFFSREGTGFKTPSGISVSGYASCSHWALTRSLIGLPRTGPFDHANTPFELIGTDLPRPKAGRFVVEVHPALALWLWCKQDAASIDSWEYKNKKNSQLQHRLWRNVLKTAQVAEVLNDVRDVPPTTDDELDARVAYALGRLWVEAPDAVVVLGNLDVGTFLVPRVAGVEEAFARFLQPSGSRKRSRRPS